MDKILTPEEGAELKSLYKEHAEATTAAVRILETHGMESPEFHEADRRIGRAWVRIRTIRGDADKHWMA